MAEEQNERDIRLGPFFTAGVLLLAFGLLRRRKLAVGAGLASMWIDQRSALGRGITNRIVERAEQQAERRSDPTAAS